MISIAVPAPSIEAVQHLRAACITSTEVAALFGESPYVTERELWSMKSDSVVSSIEDNERLAWGRALEAGIGQEVCRQNGWTGHPRKVFEMRTDCRLGASFDFEVHCPERGNGILEIKNVDSLVFRNAWSIEDGELLPPPHIEIQAAAQLCVAQEYGWVCIAALVGGNRIQTAIRERRADVEHGIIQQVNRFWDSVIAGVAPPWDFEKDIEFINREFGVAGEREVTMNDPRLIEVLADYKAQSSLKSEADKRMKELRAELLTMIGDASKVLAPGFKVTAGMVAGREVAARYQEPYRNVRVYSTKENITP